MHNKVTTAGNGSSNSNTRALSSSTEVCASGTLSCTEPVNKQESLVAWLKLIRDRRWSRKQKAQLLAHFSQATTIYAASEIELRAIVKGRYQSAKAQINQADIDADLAWLKQANHALVTQDSRYYPPALAQIHDSPLAFFCKGDLRCLEAPKVAVVGSRRPTPVGEKIVKQLASDMARVGLVVVSGMALGIDGLAHRAALDIGQPTIAVMACGLDQVYPSRHRHLFSEIADKGLLISEYPLGYAPTKYTFGHRNRIVSGLSFGVLIVEAAERSGTLITARLAAEQNREVMVVPGSCVSAQYRGSHRLLQQGAALVSCLDDIVFCLREDLSNFCLESLGDLTQINDHPQVSPLLRHLGSESVSIDELVKSTGLTAAQLCSMLLALEIDGLVKLTDDGGYISIV